MNSHLSDPSEPTPVSNAPRSPRLLPLAIGLGLVICLGGGFLTGYMLTRHPVWGVILLGVGWMSGWASRRITGETSRAAGYCMVAACILSFSVSMVSWYRWSFTLPDEANEGARRDPTWQEAIVRAPRILLQDYPVTLVISGLCAAFGASEAFRQTGRNA